jgi:hypothetical protein
MAIQIQSEQKFTDVGLLGAGLFIGGPTVGAICYGWYLYQISEPYSYESSAKLAALCMAVSGVAFLVGCILTIIGRTQTHTVTQIKDRQEAGQQLWS